MTMVDEGPLDTFKRVSDAAIDHQRVANIEAQIHTTHRWVVLIAWVVVLQATLGLCFGVAATTQYIHNRHAAAAARNAAYQECLNSDAKLITCSVFLK